MTSAPFDVLTTEDRVLPPQPSFARDAPVADDALYAEADADYQAFWARQARELLSWHDDFSTILDWRPRWNVEPPPSNTSSSSTAAAPTSRWPLKVTCGGTT